MQKAFKIVLHLYIIESVFITLLCGRYKFLLFIYPVSAQAL